MPRGLGLGVFGICLWSRPGAQFLLASAVLQIGWILLNCLLYSALIHANNLLVPTATTLYA